MSRLCSRVAAGALTLALLVGCEPPRVLGEQCDLNSNCEYPLVCHLVRCRRQCDTVRDCPIGALCVPTNQGYGVCLLPEEMGCALDSDCPGELVCLDGRCGNECTDDAQCAPGARCEGEEVGTRACVDPSLQECERDSECAPLACVAGRCAIECLSDRDCLYGERCREGTCNEFQGADAGSADAGTPAPDSGSMMGDAGSSVVATCAVAADCRAPGVSESDCVSGSCVVRACTGDLADCNGTYEDGCEVDTQTDPAHCGSCGTFCGYGSTCTAATCEGRVVDFDLGEWHSCAALTTGLVVCFGQNDSGELGMGYTSHSSDSIVSPDPVVGLSDARSVAVGDQLTCAVRATGEVACWGRGNRGQIGEGRFSDRYSARTVLTVTDAEEVGTASAFACARTAAGAVYCWGSNDQGQLGTGTTTSSNEPVLVSGLSDAVDIAVGRAFGCAVRMTGAVVCWGSDEYGQLGDGAGAAETCGTDPCSTSAVAVSGITDAVRIDAGRETACAVHATGAVSCWGRNRNGNLGIGVDGATQPSAEAPVSPTISNVTEVSVGGDHACARHADGTVSCWGGNGFYSLGDGTMDASTSPVSVSGLSDATAIDVHGARSCALRASGPPVCWGTREYGLLGIDTNTEYWLTPQPLDASFPR